jgi:hypothetical protein
MKRVVIGSVLAALVVFMWGFLYWNVLPFRNSATQAAPDEPALAQALAALPGTGTYQIPDLRANASQEAYLGRYGEGPVALILLHKEGVNLSDPSMFINGFLHMLVTSLLIGLVLWKARLATFGARFGLVFLAGLAAAIFANLGEPIWYYQPWDWNLLQFGYDLTVWILIGLVMAKFVQPEPSTARL